jgi:hypothetical protein
MSFRVVWMRSALDLIAPALKSGDRDLRQAVKAAMREAEAHLGVDPFSDSESREGDDRIAFFPPLTLHFFVVPNAALVSIFHARFYGKE